MAQTHTEIEIDFAINQTQVLTFNTSYETIYFINMTPCDRAGNCNDSEGDFEEFDLKSPVGLCSGWSIWSMHQQQIALSNVSSDTTSDFVYWWNATNQAWAYYTSTATGKGNHKLDLGDVVWLYDATDLTWWRNRNDTDISGRHEINLTIGHAYLPILFNTTFGNLSTEIFRNETGGNTTLGNYTGILPDGLGDGGLEFQIDFFAGYNNTDHEWVSHIWGWDWKNDTTLGPYWKNGLDAIYIFTNYSLSVNLTAGGFVYANSSSHIYTR